MKFLLHLVIVRMCCLAIPLQSDGKVFLCTRLLTELDPYIKDVYRGFSLQCAFCGRVCVRGQKCGECEQRVHTHCATKNFSDIKHPKCPAKDCDAEWVVPNNRIAQGLIKFQVKT